jgi:MtaA/CmuA family methyltransferase
MNPRELLRAAMRRERTERIPVMPQICHDLAVRIFEGEFAADWIDGMKSCAENPDLIYEQVIRLARQTGVDGLRLFVRSDPLRVERVGESLVVLDRDGGERIGRLDIHGGGEFIPDLQEPPVDTLVEYRARLKRLETEYTGEKLELLRRARARVPDLFVASAPGGITMNTYTKFRGREQALMDLYERPDFVRAALDMQTDVMIARAEKLVRTGIDALYIGDPAASASLISPRHFEEFCLPAYQRFCRHFRDTGILIYIHICGNSRPILEMMADTGAHAVEPLDPLGGVSVGDAKRRIGKRAALMGGVNTLTLSGGTAADVRAEAVRKCREGGPYGYILAAGDMVPPGTPRENLQALIDVATQSLWRE